MVALNASSDAVAAVSAALDAAERGDLSLHRRLVLSLSGARVGARAAISAVPRPYTDAVPAASPTTTAPVAPDIPPPAKLLTALTHFSAARSGDARRRAALRALLHAAVHLDFSALARPPATVPEAEPDVSLVDAYADFARNAASADSAFVEDLLNAFARKQFVLPLPRFARVLDASHDVIARILESYPHAEAALVRIVAERYPHPVRATAEHVFFARAVLRIVSYAPSHALASHLLAIVIEKMTIIDAMVPDSFGGVASEDSALGGSSPVTPQVASPSSSADTEPSRVKTVQEASDPDAAKMDAVLLEFMAYIDGSLVCGAGRVAAQRFKSVVSAFERFVLPAHGARHSPFLLLYAAASLGSDRVLTTAERFRCSFFDPNEAHTVRIAYLYYSAALIARCACVSSRDVLGWVGKMARYVHEYAEDAGNITCIDVEMHDLFYASVFAIMSVVSIRRDVFDCSVGGDADAAHRLRLLRLMSSSLNPFLVMPISLVDAFCLCLEQSIDFEDIRERNLTRTLPSRTRYGGSNRFHGFMPLGPCVLRMSKPRIAPHYRGSVQVDSTEPSDVGTDVREASKLRIILASEAEQGTVDVEERSRKRRRVEI